MIPAVDCRPFCRFCTAVRRIVRAGPGAVAVTLFNTRCVVDCPVNRSSEIRTSRPGNTDRIP